MWEKLSDDKKKTIEEALGNLKKAYESKDLSKIDSALEKINEAWKNQIFFSNSDV